MNFNINDAKSYLQGLTFNNVQIYSVSQTHDPVSLMPVITIHFSADGIDKAKLSLEMVPTKPTTVD